MNMIEHVDGITLRVREKMLRDLQEVLGTPDLETTVQLVIEIAHQQYGSRKAGEKKAGN